MTTIVGLVLVGNSGFVELQLILNNLTGEDSKGFSFFDFSNLCLLQGIGAPLVDRSIQASAKELPISGIPSLLFILETKEEEKTSRAAASIIFFVGNLSYLISSFLLAILTLHAKLTGRHEATKRRPKVQDFNDSFSIFYPGAKG